MAGFSERGPSASSVHKMRGISQLAWELLSFENGISQLAGELLSSEKGISQLAGELLSSEKGISQLAGELLSSKKRNFSTSWGVTIL